jgi:hypothetical protein
MGTNASAQQTDSGSSITRHPPWAKNNALDNQKEAKIITNRFYSNKFPASLSLFSATEDRNGRRESTSSGVRVHECDMADTAYTEIEHRGRLNPPAIATPENLRVHDHLPLASPRYPA